MSWCTFMCAQGYMYKFGLFCTCASIGVSVTLHQARQRLVFEANMCVSFLLIQSQTDSTQSWQHALGKMRRSVSHAV